MKVNSVKNKKTFKDYLIKNVIYFFRLLVLIGIFILVLWSTVVLFLTIHDHLNLYLSQYIGKISFPFSFIILSMLIMIIHAFIISIIDWVIDNDYQN